MRISDWSSDVCSSDLGGRIARQQNLGRVEPRAIGEQALRDQRVVDLRAPLLERGTIAFEPARAGMLVGIADDEPDAIMPHREQMPGHRACGLEIVDRKSTRLNSSP